MSQSSRGFTLIELAVVLFIISLLLVGLLGPVATQIEAKERQDNIDMMENVVEALYGYAVINGRLPCPDSDGDGQMNPTPYTGAVCTAAEGWLPWVDLNTHAADIWGNRFRYRVKISHYTIIDDGICAAADANLDLCTPTHTTVGTDVDVQTRGDDPGTGAVVEYKFAYDAGDNVAAVIISHGKNGFGATSASGIARAAATAGTDEAENTDGDLTYVSRVFSEGSAGCTDDANEANNLCEYDDIVMWLSPSILMNRMVKAEVLP